MSAEKADLIDKSVTIAGKLIDDLSHDPCILAMLIVIIIAAFLIYQKDRSAERMEALRIGQYKDVMRPNKEGQDEHN